AEDGIRDRNVTGVQTCALPISRTSSPSAATYSRSMMGAVSRDGSLSSQGASRPTRWGRPAAASRPLRRSIAGTSLLLKRLTRIVATDLGFKRAAGALMNRDRAGAE